jgi:hypothetical protein
VRSLAQFLKTHKNIGLIVIDGLHLVENVEMYSVKSSSSSSHANASAGKPGPKKVGNNIMAMAAQGDVPTSDDFFGGGMSTTNSATPVRPPPTPTA